MNGVDFRYFVAVWIPDCSSEFVALYFVLSSLTVMRN